MKNMEKRRYSALNLNLVFVAVIALIFATNGQVFGQNEIKKVVVPTQKPRVATKIPKKVVPFNPSAGNAISIEIVSPVMAQSNVALNSSLTWKSTPATGLMFDVYIGKREMVNQAGQPQFIKAVEGMTSSSYFPSLENAELYHWKVVAKNSSGISAESATGYFTTPNAPPSVPQLTSPGNNATGIAVLPTLVWQPSADPEGKPLKYSIYITDESGQYTSPAAYLITGTTMPVMQPLQNGETYFWKIVAHDNMNATAESMEFQFTVDPVNWTSPVVMGSFTDYRDNKTYKTAIIGQKEWMAENLALLPAVNNVGTTADLPMFKVYDYTGSQVDEAKNTTNFQTYGVLYNWNAVQQICPSGWHLPSEAEWNEMLLFLGMNSNQLVGFSSPNSDIVADKMRVPGSDYWTIDRPMVNNASQFSALPAGSAGNSIYYGLGTNASWWSSTLIQTEGIVTLGISYPSNTNGGITRGRVPVNPWFFHSVRCVKD